MACFPILWDLQQTLLYCIRCCFTSVNAEQWFRVQVLERIAGLLYLIYHTLKVCCIATESTQLKISCYIFFVRDCCQIIHLVNKGSPCGLCQHPTQLSIVVVCHWWHTSLPWCSIRINGVFKRQIKWQSTGVVVSASDRKCTLVQDGCCRYSANPIEILTATLSSLRNLSKRTKQLSVSWLWWNHQPYLSG